MTDRISSSRAAALIGIKTSTLAHWRMHGKGPAGAVRIGRTFVVYALADVESFIIAQAEAGKSFGGVSKTATA